MAPLFRQPSLLNLRLPRSHLWRCASEFLNFFVVGARCLSAGRTWDSRADQQGFEPPPAVCQRWQDQRHTNWAIGSPQCFRISKADPRHSNQEVRLHELYEHSSVTTQSKWMPWWLIPPGSSSPMQWYAHKFGSTQNLKRLLKPLASLPQASQTNDSVDPFHKFLVQDRRSSKLPCPGRRPPQVQRKPWRSQRSSCPRHSDSIQAPQTTFAPQVQCLLQALTWLPL